MVTFPYQNPVYQPAMRLISGITNAVIPTVTTSFAHQYVTGTIVRIDITQANGMYQLNQQTSPISVSGPTTFTIAIDTTNYDTFVASTPATIAPAQVVPVGEVSSTLAAATVNVLPL